MPILFAHRSVKPRRPAWARGLSTLALAAIRVYQRYVSPRKGFCCAYRLHLGRASCSALGCRAIRRHGVWRGVAILRMRLEKCGQTHRRYKQMPYAMRRQAGFCDVGCDLPCSGEGAGCVGDVIVEALPCDGCGSSRKRRDRE